MISQFCIFDCLLCNKPGFDDVCLVYCADTNVLEFENGYLVETVVEGNEIGVVPYKIQVSDDGELYAVDEVNSNVMKITPPLSQCKNFTHCLRFI